MKITPPEGLTVVDRDYFLRGLCKIKDKINANMRKTNNKLKIYGGLIKRGFSRSDLDLGVANFIKPEYEELGAMLAEITATRCPECNIKPSLNPLAYGKAVMNMQFDHMVKYCDKLETYQKLFDATVDSFLKIQRESKIYNEIKEELKRNIEDTINMCSKEKNIEDAFECHRTQLHSRRDPLGDQAHALMYEVSGRTRPIKRFQE